MVNLTLVFSKENDGRSLIINCQLSIVSRPCHPERSVAVSNAERDTKCRDLGRNWVIATTRDPTFALLGSPTGFDFVRKRTPLKMTRVVLLIDKKHRFCFLSSCNLKLEFLPSLLQWEKVSSERETDEVSLI